MSDEQNELDRLRAENEALNAYKAMLVEYGPTMIREFKALHEKAAGHGLVLASEEELERLRAENRSLSLYRAMMQEYGLSALDAVTAPETLRNAERYLWIQKKTCIVQKKGYRIDKQGNSTEFYYDAFEILDMPWPVPRADNPGSALSNAIDARIGGGDWGLDQGFNPWTEMNPAG